MEHPDPPSPFDVAPTALLPPVLAVVVRHPSGEPATFTACLQALAAQDHPDLRVVVVDTAGDDDLQQQVEDVLPQATVHRALDASGFGAAANVVLADDGHEIPYFLFCHDDVAPEPGATRGLVDAARTWHAAVVGPKFVCWDDPTRLAQLGEAVTRTGVTVPLVEPGERDQGQHDIVQEAFTVPGGFTLVRADVFRRIGGFDEEISYLADDLSLCWRARLAGARVVVEPSVRVRHRASLAERLPLRMRLRLLARHRLRVVLTSYNAPELLRVLPLAALASLVEAVVALLAFRPSRARAALAAWRWNLKHLRSVRAMRRQVAELRQVDDRVVRHLHAGGVVRPQLRRAFPVPAGGPATATSRGEDAEDAEADPMGVDQAGGKRRRRAHHQRALAADGAGPLDARRAWRAAVADRVETLRAGWTSGGAIVLLGIVAALVLGSRHLVTRGMPVVGQLALFPPPGELLDQWRSGWRPTGLGVAQAGPSALGVLGGLGRLVGGHMGFLRLVLTLGLVPLGIAGAFRLLRPAGSPRAPVAAAVAYACVPAPYAALAQGRWASLAVYAAAPWLLGQLVRATSAAPFGSHTSPVRLVLRLGLVTALLAVVVPVAPLLLVGLALALVAGGLLAFEARGVLRVLVASLGGAVVAVALHLPWSADAARSWWSAPTAVGAPWPGLALPSRSPSGVGDLLASGMGGLPSVLWWALPLAAALVLLVGRGWRLTWGIRGWALALLAWVAAWAVGSVDGHGGAWRTLPAADVLLPVAGVGLALAVGMGVAAVEHDVAGHRRRFRLRRMATALALVALGLATLPLLRATLDGDWGMPDDDLTAGLGFVDESTAKNDSRVLWVGDPEALPTPGWPAGRRLAYATSEGLPTVADLWPGPVQAPTDRIGQALRLALDRRTARLGGLLAPMAIEYLVVPPDAISPPPDGTSSHVPRSLEAALDGQLDLERVDVDPALLLYRNTAALPGPALLDAPGSTTDAAAAVPPDAATSSQLRERAGLPLSYDTPTSHHVQLAMQVALWLVAAVVALVPTGHLGRWRRRRAERKAERREARHLARAHRREQAGTPPLDDLGPHDPSAAPLPTTLQGLDVPATDVPLVDEHPAGPLEPVDESVRVLMGDEAGEPDETDDTETGERTKVDARR